MKIFSWNVNSLRSCEENFLEFLSKYNPDIVMIQELRATPDQLSFFLKCVPNYQAFFNDSGRPGYGGTALYYKDNLPVKSIISDVGNKILSSEGRVIKIELKDLQIYNFYTPNGNSSDERLKYKLSYYKEILELVKIHKLQGDKVIIGGDLNVAHTQNDVFFKNPQNSGFLFEERQWFDEIVNLNYYDTFRLINQNGGQYTWWHMRDPQRVENKGWRYDYILASESLKSAVKDAGICKEVFGSDHCPIWCDLDI